MSEILELTAGLPEVTLAPGDVLVTEGGASGSLWVLLSGSMRVTVGGAEVNAVTHPGAVIGEVSLLLDRPFTATVTAVETCVLRHAADGLALLDSDARIARIFAVGLAERLAFVTTYLADLKHQYGDAPGLAMVGDVLRRLELRTAPRARPGSAREPDPEY